MSRAVERSSGWTSLWMGWCSHFSRDHPVMASKAGFREVRLASGEIVRMMSEAASISAW
jgi:hypothetical protein